MVTIGKNDKPKWISDAGIDQVRVRIQRFCPDRNGRYYYDSSNYVFWLEFKLKIAVIFHVKRGRVRDVAFSAGLTADELKGIIKIMVQNELTKYVKQGLSSLLEFVTERQDITHSVTAEQVVAIMAD